MLRYLKTYFAHGLLLCLLWTGAAQAGFYRCLDSEGNAAFQDRPCVGAPSLTQATDTLPDGVQPTPPKAVNKENLSFLWQAEIGEATFYLLGSIHFGVPEMYPLPAVIGTAFMKADTLVVEADILDIDPVAMAQLVASKAVYKEGEKLNQQLAADTWKRLSDVADELKVPMGMLDMQKPWFVSMTLTALAINRLGFSEELGLDRYFLNKARGNKNIVELEGVEWQLGLFDLMPVSDQVLMLEQTLRDVNTGRSFFDRMLKAWKSGDSDGIQALFEEGEDEFPESKRLNKLLITDRNYSMGARLEKLSEKGGTFFVVVGAGHFTGNEGIIALLSQKGYQVTQL
ncbi:TraB/GumN family protein [Pseudomonadota bacterium]